MSRNRLILSILVLLAVAAVVAFVVLRTEPEDEAVVTPPAAPPERIGDWIEVYFTTPQPQGRPSPSGSPGRLDERLAATIDGAQRTVDVAAYDLELDNVADALIRAHRRGVRVRLVTDSDNTKNEPFKRVSMAGAPVVEDNRGPIMHHKLVVLDGERLWTGSWNFAPGDTFRHNNHGVLIRSRELAENYTAEFEKMFTGRRFGPT